MSELHNVIQAEQQRLYEVSSLTDELMDDDAQILLSWASIQLPKLTVISATIEDVERTAKGLRKLVRSMNRYAGQIQNMSIDEQQEKLERIYTSASELNYPVQSTPMPILLAQFRDSNTHDALTLLIAWLDGNTQRSE